MAKTATILLLGRDRLVRADLAGRPARVVDVHEERRPAIDDPVSLVEAALALSRARPGRVWILNTEVWTQTLSLAGETATGLSPAELARALAFESEPFSGISGLDARLGFREIASQRGGRLFWLAAVSASQMDEIDRTVSRAGGRLAGIAHPGGLGRPLCLADGAHPWQRVELWPGAIVCLEGLAGAERSVRVVNTDPRPGRWQPDVERWHAEAGAAAPEEMLLATGSVGSEELERSHWLNIEEPEVCRRFLAAWAEALDKRVGLPPLVEAPKKPLSAGARQAIAAVVAVAGLAACLGHYALMESVRAGQEAETARLRVPAQQLAALKKEADPLRDKSKKLVAECDKLSADLAHCQTVMLGQRQRLAALMAVLGRQDTGELVLEKIEGAGDALQLSGLALRAEAAESLAGDLASALEPLGWRVELPNRHAHLVLAGGGPWQFELRLYDPAAKKLGAAANGPESE